MWWLNNKIEDKMIKKIKWYDVREKQKEKN